ncbi:MAG: histidine kinase [Actinobacteria bacterium]|nr:histidine kinase [Actinomycetota bacterium]
MDDRTPERLSIARELHDGIAQDLVALGYSIDVLLADSVISQPVREGLRGSRFQIDELISKVRNEILKLRDTDEHFTQDSLKKLVLQICPTIECTFDVADLVISSSDSSELSAIVTEILRNIQAHSRATHIVIKTYMLNNKTCLEISDDGTGGAVMKDGHWGLAGVKERIENLSGSFAMDNKFGTKITILL